MTMKKISKILLCATLASVSAGVNANNDLDDLRNLAQDQFRDISEILGAATSYKALTPAEPLGITGFDLGFELTATNLDNDLFDAASNGDWDLDYLPLPKIHVHKGLPFNIDVGAFYAGASGTDIKLWGGEVRYAFIEGNVAIPAVSARLTYSRLEGVDDFDLQNMGIEVTVSKGFAIFTPYGGIGRIRTESEVDNSPLDKESIDMNKIFAGVNINLGVNFTLEGDITGGTKSFGLKVGFRF
ncbi:MAG: DUF6588 family protein [Gammaproteobacteria bacterium]